MSRLSAEPSPRLPEVVTLAPVVHRDDRGFFLETYNARDLAAAIGREPRFVQDNHSRSARGVLRGLHYQLEQPQAKLVRVATGRVFDVAVDVRRGSPSYGAWTGQILDETAQRQLWIPEGFAHGFLVLSETADVLYKTTDYYLASAERAIRYDDPQIAIEWPDVEWPAGDATGGPEPVLSERDRAAPALADAEVFA